MVECSTKQIAARFIRKHLGLPTPLIQHRDYCLALCIATRLTPPVFSGLPLTCRCSVCLESRLRPWMNASVPHNAAM